jgi:hypothetical protein
LRLWTTLIGPVLALLSALWLGVGVLSVYLAWVIFSRLFVLWLYVPDGLVVRPLHLALQLYDQWVGSAIKVAALMLMHRQSWSKAKTPAARSSHPWRWPGWREVLIWHRLTTYVGFFALVVLLMGGLLRWPAQWHVLP